MAREWLSQANCEGLADTAFIPPDWETNDADEADRLDAEWYAGPGQLALAICNNCVVRAECFDMALEDEHTIANGVWGGTTPEVRSRFLETLSVRG